MRLRFSKKILQGRFITALLIPFLICACQPVESPAPVIPYEPPLAQIKSVYPVEVTTGEAVVFEGSGETWNGILTMYKWRSSLDGELSNKSSFTTKILSEGKHKIFFSIQDDTGAWSPEATTSVIISPPIPRPVINYFKAAPARIGLEEYAILSWYASGAATVSIDQGIGSVAIEGKRIVSPKISATYTLTATNASGDITAAVNVIVIPVANTGLPVIRSFAADPGSIAPGTSTILRWEVSNADAVKIDPNIGVFSSAGSATTTPKATTSYTLTAYNSTGIVTGTTQVLVEPAAAAGKADLFISDIYKVTTPAGMKIAYTVENRGTQASPASSSRLYANGEYKAIDTIGALAAGAKAERQFNWNYNPATSIIRIVVDADNNVADSDRSNNEMLINLPVSVVYDFVANAPGAKWTGGNPPRNITFGSGHENQQGSALYRTDSLLEDGTGPGKYLETQPDLTYRGIITGDYEIGQEVKPGDHFYGLIGLLDGADSGNVSFQVYIRTAGEADWHEMGQAVNAPYDYRIDAMVVPVPPEYFGKKVDPRLSVLNVREPLQSWAVWVEAKIIR